MKNMDRIPRRPRKPAIELVDLYTYSTGPRGPVKTNIMYKRMNQNFGAKVIIRNNTDRWQEVKIGVCLYDAFKNALMNWKTRIIKIKGHGTYSSDYYCTQESFDRLLFGKYSYQFWINDKKMRPRDFAVRDK